MAGRAFQMRKSAPLMKPFFELQGHALLKGTLKRSSFKQG